MEKDENAILRRCRVEDKEEWRKWCKEAPWLQFPPELEVKIIPPFAGAMARFMVRFPGSNKRVSVYWDVGNCLGVMDVPYWEIYPVKYKNLYEAGEDGHDTKRFLMGEEPEMMVSIIKSLMGEYDE